MRTACLLAGALVLCFASELHAQHGLPSQNQLAALGLADIHILSDYEASTIRVRGYPPNRWGNLYNYVKGISRLEPRPPFVRRAHFLR